MHFQIGIYFADKLTSLAIVPLVLQSGALFEMLEELCLVGELTNIQVDQSFQDGFVLEGCHYLIVLQGLYNVLHFWVLGNHLLVSISYPLKYLFFFTVIGDGLDFDQRVNLSVLESFVELEIFYLFNAILFEALLKLGNDLREV
jgi:hypothetical protein